jgi:predicted HicB family RNase H-like nuclease
MAETVVTKSGHVLTEDDLNRMADEAEHGFDLSKWVHKRGRPPLEQGAAAHSPRIAVRVPESLHDRVATRAADEGRTVSQVVRSLLEEYANGHSQSE